MKGSWVAGGGGREVKGSWVGGGGGRCFLSQALQDSSLNMKITLENAYSLESIALLKLQFESA